MENTQIWKTSCMNTPFLDVFYTLGSSWEGQIITQSVWRVLQWCLIDFRNPQEKLSYDWMAGCSQGMLPAGGNSRPETTMLFALHELLSSLKAGTTFQSLCLFRVWHFLLGEDPAKLRGVLLRVQAL
jgi:hypothetical protein